MRFKFDVDLEGEGDCLEEAWENAIERLIDNPGGPPDPYNVVQEDEPCTGQ